MKSQPTTTKEISSMQKVRCSLRLFELILQRTMCRETWLTRWLQRSAGLIVIILSSTTFAQDIPSYSSQPNFPSQSGFGQQPNYGQLPIPGNASSAPTFNPAPNAFDPWSNAPQVAPPPVNGQAFSGQNQPFNIQPPINVPQPYTTQQPLGTSTFGGAESVQGVPLPSQPQFVPGNQPLPGANALPAPAGLGDPLPPLNSPWTMDANGANTSGLYQPRVRDVPIDVYLQEAQTGRFILGGSVNTDLGVAGQVILEERNFDITRFPRGFRDLFNGAFRGGGQNFRLEAVPGNQVQRYSVDWTEPNLFGYSPYSLSVGGFFFNRIYRDFDEERIGGRVAIGYVVTPDLQVSSEIRLENVELSDPRVAGVQILERSLGDNDVYTGRVRLTHNTRDSPFLPTEGHFFEAIYDQVFGEYDFPRIQLNYSRYFLIRERADGGGRHTLTSAHRLGFSGEDTPIFENFFAGGFTTLRGFRFRGASPTENDVQVGGRMQFLGSLEYMMPLTADDMLRLVTFVDYGIIERDIDFNWDNFRVAPGLGLRVAVPAMGPAPLAFDFAFPLNEAVGDQTQVFSFSVGVTR